MGMRVGAALGLLGAIVIGLLAMSPMESLITGLDSETSGALNTAIGSFNFLLLLIVVLAVTLVFAAVMGASKGRR